jgi:general stress protein YciG
VKGDEIDPLEDHRAVAGKRKRGFAAMDAAKQKAIASKGGKAAQRTGTAHRFTSQEAREAGRKGGVAASRDAAHMATIGRQGGRSSQRRRGNPSPR